MDFSDLLQRASLLSVERFLCTAGKTWKSRPAKPIPSGF